MQNWIFDLMYAGFMNGIQNLPLLFFPAFLYAAGCTVLALLIGWGTILYEETDNGVVLKLPGGAILVSPPLVETLLLGLWLTQPAVSTPDLIVGQFLTFFLVLRMVLWILAHLLVMVGSLILAKGKQFSLECMDGRCTHGTRQGIFMHYWACGGFTLLSALGFAPLVPLAIWFGLPEGAMGMIALVVLLFPYPLVISKFVVKLIHNDILLGLIKGATDIIMLSEVPGFFIATFTASAASFRLMLPGVSPTRLH